MKIRLNGAWCETKEHSLHSLRRSLFNEGDVLIINGYQTEEERSLKEGDEIVIISKGKMADESQMEAMLSARHSPGVYEKLKKAKVAIAGLGGLGSNIASSLARTGIGELLLVDYDIVEPSNLNRQSYWIQHLGLPKTQAMAEQIQQMNPFVKVKLCDLKVTKENAASLFEGYDIICEAFDDPGSKVMLVETLLEANTNCYLVCGSGMAGYGSANLIRSARKMKRLYLCGDEVSEAREGCGLMMPRVQVCAGHQANMVLRLILGVEEV